MKHSRGVLATLVAAIVIACAAPVRAQDAGVVVVSSWGGSFMDAQRESMFKPFEEETGIKVVEATTPEFAKIRAMVESGNTEWDVVTIVPSDYIALVESGQLEKLDYSRFDRSVLDAINSDVIFPYGIGNDYYAEAIAYSIEPFPEDDHPKSWADVWDVERFSGPRMLYSAEWVIRPNEGALLANGVIADQIYPLDLERSYRALDRIRPHDVKWATTPAMPPQALVDGEAVIVQPPLNRIQKLKGSSAPVDYVWDGARAQYERCAIPKGAKYYHNAIKFIEHVSSAEPLARLSMIQPLGPVNRKSYDLIPLERARILPGNLANIDKLVFIDAEWWARKDENGKSNVEKKIEMWHIWRCSKCRAPEDLKSAVDVLASADPCDPTVV